MNPRFILDRLWAARRRKQHAPTVGAAVAPLLKEVKCYDTACQEIAEFWALEIPEIMPKIKSMRMSFGVVTVTTDAATAYALARRLRSGLEIKTMRACRTPIRRIKTAAA